MTSGSAAERTTSSADAHAARVELFLHPDYGVRASRAAAERLAQDRDVRRQDTAQLQAKLECLKLRGWQTANAPRAIVARTLSSFLYRALYLEKYGCGTVPRLPPQLRSSLVSIVSCVNAACSVSTCGACDSARVRLYSGEVCMVRSLDARGAEASTCCAQVELERESDLACDSSDDAFCAAINVPESYADFKAASGAADVDQAMAELNAHLARKGEPCMPGALALVLHASQQHMLREDCHGALLTGAFGEVSLQIALACVCPTTFLRSSTEVCICAKRQPAGPARRCDHCLRAHARARRTATRVPKVSAWQAAITMTLPPACACTPAYCAAVATWSHCTGLCFLLLCCGCESPEPL
jgi:hypothetical protein